MKIDYNSKGLQLVSDSLQEAMTIDECLASGRIRDNELTWHYLITRESGGEIRTLKSINALRVWGLNTNNGADLSQRVLASKIKRYLRSLQTLEEVKETEQYKRAMELIENMYGKPLKDGRVFFPYQKETAAFMIATKRLLLALDMGLGKTLTTLIGLTADPSNRKVLIVTMSRNFNDWVKEIDAIGLSDDYIILNSKNDLHSNKRIHIVSYEKWARDNVTFAKKPREACPDCSSSYYRAWNMNLGYCYVCKTNHSTTLDDRWDEKDLPEKCPYCKNDWKGHYQCRHCEYNVIESRKPALYHYYHNGYDATAIDEGHYIKNGKSKRSQAVRRINTEKRYILTGTPAENGSDDLFWQLAWLTGCDSRFEDPIATREGNPKPFQGYGKIGEEHFREYYSGGKKRAILDIDSIEPRSSNHEELWGILDRIMIRKRKTDEDVKDCIEVPAPNHHRMHLQLHLAERELYDKMLEDFSEWYRLEIAHKEAAKARGDKYRISTIEICAWLDKLRKAASSPWQFEEYDEKKGATTAKLEFVKNKAKELLRRGKKMLIFSGHKETVEHLGVLMDGVVPGKEAAYIHGDVKMSYRWELLNRFQDPNDPLSILVLSHRTGAESYTLSEAKAVFLFDLDFNAKKIEQCYSRAVRLGQKDVVEIYWLIGVDTIDANMHGLVLSKASGVDLAIDRKSLDFEEIAKEFEGDTPKGAATSIDYEKFASEMLGRGTRRTQIA